MCITKTQIQELSKIIMDINTCENEKEKMEYLKENVEDVELFVNTLRNVNKSKLQSCKKKKNGKCKVEHRIYDESEILELFTTKGIEHIVQIYSKNELSSMYYTIYKVTPLSTYNKERIAEMIKGYVYDMNRAKTLLG